MPREKTWEELQTPETLDDIKNSKQISQTWAQWAGKKLTKCVPLSMILAASLLTDANSAQAQNPSTPFISAPTYHDENMSNTYTEGYDTPETQIRTSLNFNNLREASEYLTDIKGLKTIVLRYTYPKDSKPETYKPKYKYYAFLPYEYQNKYVNTYKDPTDAAQLCYAHKLPFTPDLQRKNKNIGYAHINETSVNNLIDKFIPMEFTIDDIDDLKGRINQIYTSYTELFNKKNTEGLYLLIVALDDEYYKYKVEGKSPTKSNWTVVSREKLTNPDNKTKTDGDSLNTTKDLSAPASPVTLDAPTTNPYLYKAHTETAAPDTPTPVKTVTPIPAETITPTTDPKASAETVTPTADPAMLTEIDNLEAKNADLESHISTKNLEYSNLFISNENFARKYNELMDAHNNLIEEHKTMKTANEVLKSTKNNYKRIGGAILLATAAFYCFRICRWGQKSKNSDINVNNNPNIPVNNTPGTPVSNNSDISVNIDKDAESIKKLKRIVINTLENKEKPQEKLL